MGKQASSNPEAVRKAIRRKKNQRIQEDNDYERDVFYDALEEQVKPGPKAKRPKMNVFEDLPTKKRKLDMDLDGVHKELQPPSKKLSLDLDVEKNPMKSTIKVIRYGFNPKRCGLKTKRLENSKNKSVNHLHTFIKNFERLTTSDQIEFYNSF